MKKHHLILAAACVMGAGAHAQSSSSITIYGFADLGLGKPIGSSDTKMLDAAGSRLGLMGSEDLRGGMKALFRLEHRFDPDTGAQNAAVFWHGQSWVGLSGRYGQLTLGRHYTAAFLGVQNQIDPWGADTVANLRDVGMRTGGITKVRVPKSLRYAHTLGAFSVQATLAEAPTNAPDRPVSVAGSFSSGPLWLGIGVEDPEGANDRMTSVGARYTISPVTLRFGMSSGKTNALIDAKGYLVGANTAVGSGDLRMGFATSKVGGKTTAKKMAIGYHYPLTKRTKIYSDFARDSERASEKSGYDVGIQHSF